MILVLTGGVGGAKLALGFARTLGPDEVAFCVNTGDDFEHLGLHVSPDVDTLTYTLAGLANRSQGWGLEDESFRALERIGRLGGPDWFRLGDQDLGLHLTRSQWLREGVSLTECTARIGVALGIRHRLLPMSDDPVRTRVETDAGVLDFQDYFVRRRCEPRVRAIRFDGASAARPSPALTGVLQDPALRGVVIAPSNPFLSIDPLLAVPGLRARLANPDLPVIAVSPIIGGEAVKGPTAKIMAELALPADTVAVARHYRDLLSGFVIDTVDRDHRDAVEAELTALPAWTAVAGRVRCAPTWMRTLADRDALARTCVDYLDALRRAREAA